MRPDLECELATARELHGRFVPRLGRRARRRLGARDVLRVMQAATSDPDTLATIEIAFLIEDLLARGRHPGGARVTREELSVAGLSVDVATDGQ